MRVSLIRLCIRRLAVQLRFGVFSVIALFFVLLPAGCATGLQKPDISLVGVELVGLNLLEQRFILQLRIKNPNDRALSINALNFDIELNGQHFAKAVSESPVQVPKQGDAVLEIKAVSRLIAVLKQLRDAQKDGRSSVAYRLFGNVLLDGAGSLPFERAGEMPLPALEKLLSK